jgi:hypothetical protein
MTNKPFEALQNMYLFDPMTGKPLPTANKTLLKLAIQNNRKSDRLEVIKNLDILNVKSVPTHWINSIHITGSDISDEMKLNILADKLAYDNKWPLEICKMNDTIWIRTGSSK